MKKQTIFAGFALIIGIGFGAARAATVQPYQQTAFDAAQKANEPILVFVEASWCPVCAKERPILQQLYGTPEFAKLKVFDVDFDTSKPLLRQLGCTDAEHADRLSRRQGNRPRHGGDRSGGDQASA